MNLSSLASPYRMLSAPTDAEPNQGHGPECVTSNNEQLPLARVALRVVAVGGLARVVLEQTFENRHAETLRVTYRMPLPAGGAVSGYEFSVGSRTIAGRVEPRQLAREKFEQALADGRTAALLDQERSDIFTQEIGNIPPGESIVARITVDQPLAWLPEGEWELRFPTVIGPRFISAIDSAADARAVAVDVAEPNTIRSRLHLEIDVRDELSPGRKIESPSHAISADPSGRWVLSPHEGSRLDRDVVVRWAVASPKVGVALSVARPPVDAPHANVAYGLLTIVPPAPDAHAPSVPRDLIVLLDTSGSMGGPPLEQAKRVTMLLLESLKAGDRFELIEFSSAPRAWQRAPADATTANKKSAATWLSGLQAGGATEMYSAVVEALRALRPGAQRQVVLVTDGYIGGEQKLVELLHERLPADCRLHVVGVGSAVNRTLATSLSRAGRGAEVLVGLGEDAERAARRLLDRTARPVLTSVAVSGAAVVEVAPEHIPDVFAGAPIVCAVKVSPEGGDMVVRGTLAGGAVWEQTVRVPAAAHGEGNQAIVALFGREHVADLEMRWTIGRETQLIDRSIERVGVVFQIATRQTSWVATDTIRAVDPTSGTRLATQPQELPYGTSMQSFGLGGLGGSEEGGAMTKAGSLSPSGMMLLRAFSAPPAGRGAGAPPMGMAPPPAQARMPEPMVSMSVRMTQQPIPLTKGRPRRFGLVLVMLFLLVLVATILWLVFGRT